MPLVQLAVVPRVSRLAKIRASQQQSPAAIPEAVPPVEVVNGETTVATVRQEPMIDLRRGRRQRSATDARAVNVDRNPPHSPEAEQGVIGCIFLSPHECMAECIAKIKAVETWYDLRHQVIWETFVEMFDRKEAIDVINVQQRLKDKHQLESIGGIAYLAALPDTVPSAANLSFYLNIVREKYLCRKLINTCTEVVGRVYEHEGDIDSLFDEAERDVLTIRDDITSDADETPIRDIVHDAINRLEITHANQGTLMGLSTGFPDLDKMTTGMQGGEMILIAARPSLGKTSLAMNIAEAVALDQGLPVGVFSLEMSKEALIMRMLCSRARVNLRNIREGFFSERDFPKITSAAGKIAASNLWVNDISGLSILELRAKARRMKQKYGIKLMVVDYLQLLHSTSKQAQNSREREVADISGGCKSIAKELDIPVLVLSQLNREVSKMKGIQKPNMGHLRESGAIEQDADLIGLLYKAEADDDDDNREKEAVAVNLDIAKQRSGPTGTVRLTFLKTFTRFESAARISADDVPDEGHPLAPPQE